MANVSIRDLKSRYGIPQADIDMARQHQEDQRRAGMPVLPLEVQLGVVPPKKREARVSEFVDYRQGIATQGPKRAINRTETPIEYDFFRGGNVSLAYEYVDAVTERLFDTAPTSTKAKEALAVLTVICRYLAWESYECTKTAKELGKITRTNEGNMSRSLALLEQVGAIKRIRKGTSKIITVTPEGAYHGNINEHHNTMGAYKMDVIQGGKSDE